MKTSIAAALIGAASAFVAPVLAQAEPLEIQSRVTFNGICDGSAAILIDKETLLVAYDEARKKIADLFAFDLKGGKPLARRNVRALLGLDDGEEMDMEAAARDGGRIWWIGSHGLDKKGGNAPNRRVLFATNIPSTDLLDLEVLAGPFDLTDVLLASPEVAAVLTEVVRRRKPKEGGVNIEGLAIHPDGGLLVGFRSPLSGPDGMSGKALVVHVEEKSGGFEVRRVHRPNLGDRGIRDFVPTGNGYLVIAGPVASKGSSALYVWDGWTTPAPLDSDLLEDFNPEALVQLGDRWLVLSDDGKVKRADDEADDGDRKCDKIRKKNSKGEDHPNVFFRGRILGP